MPKPTTPLRRFMALACAMVLGLGMSVRGQGTVGTDDRLIRSEADVTFALLAQATQQHVYGAEQTRRFLDRSGHLSEVRERLVVQPVPGGAALFSLTFLGVVGRQTGSAEYDHWRDTYLRHASLFHEHGSFRVRDAAAAAQNYSLLHLGRASRAGLMVRRVVVFPHRLDKSIWLIDVDEVTALVVHAAEYDPAARLIGELEVTRLLSAHDVGRLPANWQWRPRSVVTAYENIDRAVTRIGAAGVVRPRLGDLAPEYFQSRVHVTENPLSQALSMVLTFTDGIDEFFLIESPGQADPFEAAPSGVSDNDAGRAHTIAYYDDPSLRVYVFHEAATQFELAGRGPMTRLPRIAQRVYTQAILRN